MITKRIHFTDLDGNPQSEDHSFSYTRTELAAMQITSDGNLGAQLEAISKSNKGSVVYPKLVEILSAAYGRRSEDGKRFVKDPQFWQEFTESPAYDELMMELLTNADAAAQLVQGMVPNNLEETLKNLPKREDQPNGVEQPAQKSLKDMTDEEFRAHLGDRKPQEMTPEELQEALGRQLGTKSKPEN